MGRRSGRAAARRANAAIGTTPHGFEAIADDEPMPEVPPSPDRDADPDAEVDDDDEEEREDDETEARNAGADEEEDRQGNAAADDEEDEDDDEDDEDEGGGGAGAGAGAGGGGARSQPLTSEPVIRRKRLGRPPKNKPPDWDLGVIVQPSEEAARPRRGRGGWRGRGGRRGTTAPSKPVQVIDKEGTTVDIVNDECVLPTDPEGETKVDELGYLQGGRDYRCRTFTVVGRGQRLYMLSTEPARCVGFRDSYLFFTKHMKLHKIIVGDEEKKDMIERDIIPHSYKGRAIGIVTARSVFREFGARIIIGGRRITDDYEVAQARAEGAVEGELADLTDPHVSGEAYNKNQYVAWHGASAVYHQNMPGAAPVVAEKVHHHVKKRRANVNDGNWMYEHALQASMYNANLSAIRRQQLSGVYDIHTNTMHLPATMQPTRARAHAIPAGSPESVSRRVARTFCVVDTACETPPTGIAATTYPGPDTGGDLVREFRGLAAVPDEVRALLPAECRAAFERAVEAEGQWAEKWPAEKEGMSRRAPDIDKAIVPYSMA
ncbi:hypothetical protein TD95_001729 [Thielaviopsis punctulata]|uniref:Chromatin structure-remodeling complex protein RSC7 n=1 Tax=Thielaviopsis punctulata TaxID=72032 RepID=A0A0F4ZBI8_9PEZI|nr:hypothetical protein TD95_001729 [Thielaviopsis punctulata]